jgi:nucleotide-binding universal stress UspA family protein
MGQTAQAVVDRAPGSVLLIPGSERGHRHAHYRRVIVPLDGSSRAESALPLALRLTKAEGAELLLVHAVPKPELTEIGPPEPEDNELRARVQHRNERVAQAYLSCVSARMSCKTPSIRTLLLRNGDSRHLLARAIEDESADLIVMASHGHGAHNDVAFGSVASHLLTHATAPILLVRNRSRPLRVHATSHRPAYLTKSSFAVPRAV